MTYNNQKTCAYLQRLNIGPIDYYTFLAHGEEEIFKFRDVNSLKTFLRVKCFWPQPACDFIGTLAESKSKENCQILWPTRYMGFVLKSYPDREDRFEITADFLTPEARRLLKNAK